MKKLYIRTPILMFMTGFILTLEGCSNPTALSTTLTQPVALPAQIATSTLQPSLTSSPTASPSPTPELTLTRTPTSTRTPTWTLVPTLPPEETGARLIDLYRDNGGCQIPCWWGIIPGETTWAQANEKLTPMAAGPVYTSRGQHGITLYQPVFRILEGVDFPKSSAENSFHRYYFDPSIFVQNETVLALDLSSGWISRDFDHSLAGLLKMLGKPGEIWLRVNTNIPPEYTPEYILQLFYPAKGVLISSGGNALRQGQELRICPHNFWNKMTRPGITLWSPQLNITFLDIDDKLFGGMRAMYLSEHVLLEDLTEDFDTSDFYETYLGPETTTCFDVTP